MTVPSAGGVAASGRAFRYTGYVLADDTLTDGSATDMALKTFEGPIPGIPVEAAVGIPLIKDHETDTTIMLYTDPTQPWPMLPINAGDFVIGKGVGMLMWGFNNTDSFGGPTLGTPATAINGFNFGSERIYSGYTPVGFTTGTSAPHDPAGVSLWAREEGIDAELVDLAGRVAALEGA